MSISLILVTDADTLTPEQISAMSGILSPGKWDRIQRFHRREDASRCLVGDLAARFAVARCAGIDYTDIRFGIASHGKPYVIGLDGMDFNISHSGEFVACVVGQGSVGVDVERMGTFDFGIAERFFDRSECDNLRELPDGQRTAELYRLWTLKESYVKAIGRGLSKLLHARFHVPLGDSPTLAGDMSGRWFRFRSYWFHLDYVCSVCSSDESFPDEAEMISTGELLQVGTEELEKVSQATSPMADRDFQEAMS